MVDFVFSANASANKKQKCPDPHHHVQRYEITKVVLNLELSVSKRAHAQFFKYTRQSRCQKLRSFWSAPRIWWFSIIPVSRSLDKGNAGSGNEKVHALPINTSTYHMEKKFSALFYIYKSAQLVYFAKT